MQIFNDKKERIGILEQFKDRKIVETLNSGDKELTFKYPCNGSQLGFLREENYIRTKTDEYVLRAHKKNGSWIEYTAQLNVEELEGHVFPFGFESREQTIRSCLEFAFEGTGWKIGECTVKKKRTINKDEETNAWDILQDCLSTYRCECKIHTLKKTIDIYETIGSDKGAYFIEGLNLKKLTASVDTYDFFTRLIPLGKDGIGIDITGKNYIENYQYSGKVKTYVWSDERYTNTTSLLEDGEAKLEEMSKPYIAYAADIIDLASQSDKYDILDFNIGDIVWIISKESRTKEKQRIVKITRYPESPHKNTVELSNIAKTFAQIQEESTEAAKTEAIQVAKSSTKKMLGDYPTAEQMDSAIKTSADSIVLEVSKTLKSYATTEEMNSAIKVSADEITSSVSKTLKDYSTTKEMNSAIKTSADEISLKVSEKVGSNEIISKINQSAEKIQIEAKKIKLKGTITVEDLAEDSGIATNKDVMSEEEFKKKCTQITKDTVTTEFINALKVKADSVDAENITGKALKGIQYLTEKRSKIDEDVTGLYIGEDGFDFCWDASNGWVENDIYGHFTIKNKSCEITVDDTVVFRANATTRVSGSNVGNHVYIPCLVYRKEYQEGEQ